MSFTFYKCPECDFTVITEDAVVGVYCGLCAGDTGRDVLMNGRPAKDDDKPEGYDARKKT